MLTTFSLSTICWAVAPALLSTNLSITAIAPEEAQLVVEYRDLSALLATVDDPAIAALLSSAVDLEEGMVGSFLQLAVEPLELLEAGAVDGESWTQAIGVASLGVATFLLPPEDEGPEELAIIGVLQWESVEAAGIAALESMLTRMEEEGEIVRSPTEIDGMTVDVITTASEGITRDDLFASEAPETARLLMARTDATTLFSMDEVGMSYLIDAIESSGTDDPIGESRRYLDAISMLPESGGTIYLDLDLLIASLRSSLGPVAAAMPLLRSIIGEIDSAAMGISPADDESIISMDVAFHMPEGPDGLSTLITDSSPRGELPPFVSSDTVSMTRLLVDFSGAMDQLRAIISRNPLLAMNLKGPLQEYGPTFEKLFGALGSTIYLVNTISMPISNDSIGSLTAIECADSQSFHDVLAIHGPSLGLTPRDFLGHQIHTMSERGPIPGGLSVGIGGQWIFLGSDVRVEDALRGLGRGRSGPPPEYLAGIDEVLGDDACVGWGFLDQGRSMSAGAQVLRLQAATALDDLEAIDADLAAETRAELDGEVEGLLEIAGVLQEHIDSVAWKLTSGDDGFVLSLSVVRKGGGDGDE